MNFSIIIPAYNEDKVIKSTIENLLDYLNKNHAEDQYEIIVVDDGSTDSTFSVLSALNGIKVIHHKKNKGYGASLKDGVRASIYEYVIFYDSDGQHKPEYLTELIKDMTKNDMVVGARVKGSHISAERILGKKILNILANYLTGVNIPDLNSGFRSFKRSTLMKYLHLLPDGFSASTTSTMIILTRGYEYKYIPIKTEKRVGKSTVNQFKDGFLTILLIIKIVTMFNPLKFFLPISIFSTLFGILYGIYKIITIKLFFPVGGLIFIMLGVFSFFFGIIADQISELIKMQKE